MSRKYLGYTIYLLRHLNNFHHLFVFRFIYPARFLTNK